MSRICSLTCVVCLSVCEFSHLTWVMNESLQSLLLFVFHRQWACCHWHVRQLRGVASPVYYLRKARIIQPWLACILHVRRQYSNDVWQHDCSFIRSSSRDTGLILHQKHLAAEVGLQDLKPVYRIQPVVQLVWQPAVSCKQTSNRLYNPVWQPAVYTIQPFVKPAWQPVWQRVWQPVVSCIQTFTRFRFDNRLYRVNGA